MNKALQSTIRNVPNFPKRGVMFRDITTLLKDPSAFRQAVDAFYEHYAQDRISKVVSIESRGFIFGAPLAYRLGAGFVPVRKPGKLPASTLRQEYALEYGTDAVEIHEDAIGPTDRVLILDDLLATGGTILAACALVERLGAEIAGLGFLIELSFLGARERLTKYNVFSLIEYTRE